MITNRSPDLSYFVSEKLTDLDLSHNNDLREVTLVHHAINIIKGSFRDPVKKETISPYILEMCSVCLLVWCVVCGVWCVVCGV